MISGDGHTRRDKGYVGGTVRKLDHLQGNNHEILWAVCGSRLHKFSRDWINEVRWRVREE